MDRSPLVILTHVRHPAVTEGFLPAAHRMGLSTVLLTDHRMDHLRHFDAHPGDAPAAILECDVFNPLSAIDALRGAGIRPAAVFSNSDHLQTSTALVAEGFGLPGKDWRTCRLAAIATRSARDVHLFLRMNIGVDGVGDTRLMMGGKPTPFGMDEADLPAAIALLRRHPSLILEGFHFHLMSHQRDADVQLRLIYAYLDAVHRWQRDYGITVHTVNAGGGFGVNYADPSRSFDWAAFCQGLRRMRADRGDTVRLRFEPGRFVSVACGWYVMEVLDIKRSHGEWFAVARGGTHHFRTPPAQGHDHPFVVLRGPGAPALSDERVTLVGQLCTPKDVLARAQPIGALAVGDCLAFPLAGAYAWNISHQNFLMHAPPRMMYLD